MRFCISCSNLKSCTISEGVKTIGDNAFSVTGLSSLVIPSTVTTIGNSVFEGCKNLTSITLPHNLTEIGFYAFTFNNQGGQ